MSEDESEVFDASDPQQWAQVLGEPSSWLLQDPEVRRVIERGRPHAIYAAFKKRLAHAPSAQAKEALAALLRDRRYFLDARNAPGMTTVNGIGMRVYGSQDRNPRDGTYITTLFFTLLFLPLWPIRQYLVARAQKGGWYFLGTVPMSAFHRWWRRIVGVASVALLAVILHGVWKRHTTADVHFLNGLDFPVAVTMGDVSLDLDSGGRQMRSFDAGVYAVRATREDGTVLEERNVEVPGGADLVVYNVLGSAALIHEVVPYAADDSDRAKADARYSSRCLAGSSWVTREDVDFVFRDAPSEIKMGKKNAVETRTHVFTVSGGWRTAASLLIATGNTREAAELARQVALLTPEDASATFTAYSCLEAHGDTGGLKTFVDEVLSAAPESIHAHRMLQEHAETHGDVAELLPRYRAAWEANPGSPFHGYLYARILPFADGLKITEPLLEQHPEDTWLLRSVGWAHFHEGRFVKALPHLERLVELVPGEKGVWVPYAARARVAAGRPADALALVASMLDGVPIRRRRGEDPAAGGDVSQLMSLYVRLQQLVPSAARGRSQAERWRQILGEEPEVGTLITTAARARAPRLVDALRPRIRDRSILRFCDMTLIACTRVEEAAKLALDMSVEELAGLDDLAQVAIACEMTRQGRRGEAKRLLEGLSAVASNAIRVEHLDALPDVSGLDRDLDPSLRAAVLYAASRCTEDPEARGNLLEQARHLDVLHLAVPEEGSDSD